MLKYSHVALKVFNLSEPSGREVSEHLGVAPTQIQEVTVRKGREKTLHHIWRLDSPKDENFQIALRVEALLDIIAPFSDRLISLDSKYRRTIDVVLHFTAQRADGRISGEFDWLMLGPSLTSKMGAWNLLFSYETFWFDHPDRQKKNL